ncbi:MAG: hypothetical protein HY303_18450, partial [Candidatus Wallbacteria bacterium]|nr:hypothetical protein [Candidatus Wallbacteria bacterium]
MSSRRQMLEKFAVIGAKAPPVLTRAMASALKGSGLPLKAEELAGLSMMLSVMGALVGLMSAGLSAGGLMITVVLAGLGAAGPVFACKASGGFREAQVARQLEAAGLDVAQAVHDGKPLQAVLATLAEKSEAPLSEELCIVLAEHRLGLPFPEALERLAIRVRTAETVQIVGVLKEHLATGSDPLDPYRLLNFQQPFEMPSVPWPAAPQSFEEVVHRLMLDVFDALEPRQIYER